LNDLLADLFTERACNKDSLTTTEFNKKTVFKPFLQVVFCYSATTPEQTNGLFLFLKCSLLKK